MSIQTDDRAIAAELLAVKTVMVHVLGRINQLDPVLAVAIQGAFGDATAHISKMVTHSGKGASSERAAAPAAMLETAKPYARIGRQRH
jgi:hypothetical protein